MFADTYRFFNSTVRCNQFNLAVEFTKETDIYRMLKAVTRLQGWKYIRVDTNNQIGFPDVLLLRKHVYWQMEAKLLKKKKLVSIQDDVKWQFGQIPYMKRSLSLELNYMLVVAKENTIAFIIGDYHDSRSYYADFAQCL